MTLKKPTHEYVAYDDHGCAVAVCADLADDFTAYEVSKLIRRGYHIERVKHEDIAPILENLGCKYKQKELFE